MDELLNAGWMALAAFGLGALGQGIDRRIALPGLLAFAIYLGADDLATVMARLLPGTDLIVSPWNWEGKIASALLALCVAQGAGLRRSDIGLVVPNANLGAGLVATTLLLALSTALGFVFQPGWPDVETLAFQMAMPGLVEEVVYRGIAPALLLGTALRALRPGEVPWGVVLATGLMFGLWHGFGVRDGVPTFDLLPAVMPTVGGLAYAWLRFRTGSLLLPMVAHAGGNALFFAHALL